MNSPLPMVRPLCIILAGGTPPCKDNGICLILGRFGHLRAAMFLVFLGHFGHIWIAVFLLFSAIFGHFQTAVWIYFRPFWPCSDGSICIFSAILAFFRRQYLYFLGHLGHSRTASIFIIFGHFGHFRKAVFLGFSATLVFFGRRHFHYFWAQNFGIRPKFFRKSAQTFGKSDQNFRNGHKNFCNWPKIFGNEIGPKFLQLRPKFSEIFCPIAPKLEVKLAQLIRKSVEIFRKPAQNLRKLAQIFGNWPKS